MASLGSSVLKQGTQLSSRTSAWHLLVSVFSENSSSKSFETQDSVVGRRIFTFPHSAVVIDLTFISWMLQTYQLVHWQPLRLSFPLCWGYNRASQPVCVTCTCHIQQKSFLLASYLQTWHLMQPILSVHLQPQQPIAFVPKASFNWSWQHKLAEIRLDTNSS